MAWLFGKMDYIQTDGTAETNYGLRRFSSKSIFKFTSTHKDAQLLTNKNITF